MERTTLRDCRILLGTKNPGTKIELGSMIFSIPESPWNLEVRDPDALLGSNLLDEAGWEVILLDSSGFSEWRKVLSHSSLLKNFSTVVILTDHEDIDLEREALRLGASDCAMIGKLNHHALERIIRQALFRRQAKKEIQEREADLLIQERLAAVGMLASGMAHEIGTPLGVIRGRAEVLLFRHPENDVIRRDLGIIIEQADRIARLMRSLLNLARGDDMKTTGALDLVSVVRDVLDIMGHVLTLEAISLKCELPSNIALKVHADSEPLHQIILNLVQNALHAIEIAKQSGRNEGHCIRISVHESGTDWCLEVGDTGCGMSQEVIRNLFRPFFTTKGIGQGVGLGLSLSLRILESWRGSIGVESQEGVGTVFKILIPRA